MYTALLSSVSFWVHQGMQTNPLHTAFIHVWKNLHTSSGSVYSKPWSFSSMTYLISVRGTNTFLYQGNSALDPWVTALGAWAHGATWGQKLFLRQMASRALCTETHPTMPSASQLNCPLVTRQLPCQCPRTGGGTLQWKQCVNTVDTQCSL